jgi:hypothetical protein
MIGVLLLCTHHGSNHAAKLDDCGDIKSVTAADRW